jgi:predicted HNH restriction endonuclease
MNQKHFIPVSAHEDPKEYGRLYREKNKERIQEYNQFRKVRQRDRLRKRKHALIEHMGGKCMKCGLAFDGENECVFDFHHEGKKEFCLSPLTRPMKDLMKEVEACIMVCANCHRLLHRGE